MENEVSDVVENGQDDSDFAAGIAGDDQTTAPASTPEPEQKEEAPQPKFAQITEDQWKELTAKATAIDEIKAESKRQFDSLNGNLGGMKQLVESLKSQRGQLTSAQLKRTTEEFPELAKLLQEDLAEAATGGINGDEIERRAQAIVAQELPKHIVQFETKLLRSYHRDWVQVVNSPEFLAWQGTLPAEEQSKFLASTDGEYIADKITEFKESRAKPKPAPQPSSRTKRLEAAVQPRGTMGQAPSSSEDDDFLAGLRSG